MLGADKKNWFLLFAQIAADRSRAAGKPDGEEWFPAKEVPQRFAAEGLMFAGKRFDASTDSSQLMEAVMNHASAFIDWRLMERNRVFFPPVLDYRLSPLGRRLWGWRGPVPGRRMLRISAVFFLLALWVKLARFKGVIAFGAVCWGVLNATKFYYTAITFVEGLPFAAWSAGAVAVAVAIWAYLTHK